MDAGVTSFVNLTEEDEGLEPYAGLLSEIAERRSLRVTHRRFPVRDLGVPSEPQMREILTTVRRALDADEVVYVHCWGGVGRTGTLVGCLLMDDSCCQAEDVLERIAVLREATERGHRASPETPEQRRFVLGWKGGLSRALSGTGPARSRIPSPRRFLRRRG